VAQDDTQIHTHMCYCEFNDIMDSIAALDADVITIETSRSDMISPSAQESQPAVTAAQPAAPSSAPITPLQAANAQVKVYDTT
ncbi:hypothetical protein, partial [Serratia sp. ME43]|uniref:hypothetical protein n=1 Tax=Serratia sp. ME43 TaxID=2744256 RepID=UPI002101F383